MAVASKWKEILSSIDTDTDFLVHGYSREAEKSLETDKESVVIPPLIIYTILMYYWMGEYFDDIDEDKVCRSDDRLKVTSIQHGWKNSSFGKTIIDSTGKNIYKWKLKVGDNQEKNSRSEQPHIMLGITTGTDTSEFFIWDNDRSVIFYGYNGYGGSKYYRFLGGFQTGTYGVAFAGGDVIEIVLDLYNKQLSFNVNDKNQGVAFESIKYGDDKKYRLVVSFYDENLSVELINFHIEYRC